MRHRLNGGQLVFNLLIAGWNLLAVGVIQLHRQLQDDRNRIVYIAQLRLTGTSTWGTASIETPSLTATADQIEHFIVAQHEAIRISREWQQEQCKMSQEWGVPRVRGWVVRGLRKASGTGA